MKTKEEIQEKIIEDQEVLETIDNHSDIADLLISRINILKWVIKED
jgi:hypothetical protein